MLRSLVDLAAFESTIATEPIAGEQRSLIGMLRQRLGDEPLTRLREEVRDPKSDEGRWRFYEGLAKLAVTATLDLGALYSKLSGYIDYLRARRSLAIPALCEELDRLRARVRRRLLAAPQASEWRGVERQLYLVSKAVDLRLAPDEYQQLKAVRTQDLFAQWSTFLSRVVSGQQVTLPSHTEVERAQSALSTLGEFYEIALRRADIIAGNAIAKVKEAKEQLAVLITGGFCRPFVIPLLKAQGAGIVVLMPQVGTRTNDRRLYREVIKYKSGHSSFERVMAIANDLAQDSRHAP